MDTNKLAQMITLIDSELYSKIRVCFIDYLFIISHLSFVYI